MTHDIAATHIMRWLHDAEDDLLGRTIQTFNGEAGTCKGVKLSDDHGLCFTIDDPPHLRWYPVSTIRMKS